MKLIAIVAVLALAGCAGMTIPLPGGGSTEIFTSPQAKTMRGCADGIDVFTPGFSPMALPGLARGSAAALGSTPEEAMAKCLALLRAVDQLNQ